MCTPVDPIFLILPYLVKSAKVSVCIIIIRGSIQMSRSLLQKELDDKVGLILQNSSLKKIHRCLVLLMLNHTILY